MNKQVTGFLVLTMISSWLAGCSPQANPAPGPIANTNDNETNDEQANAGKTEYGAWREGMPKQYITTDFSNSSQIRKARSAHGMAYELESLSEVKGCAVVVVGDTAYVAVRPAQGYVFDAPTEQRIREKIDRINLNQKIRNVYVTAEPRAVEFLSGYSGALEQGRPIASYEKEFQTMVRQTWPNGQE